MPRRPQAPAQAGDERGRAARRQALCFAALVLYGAAAAAFFALRPAGRWAENDTAVLAEAAAAVMRGQRLAPVEGTVYAHGYGYQAAAAFLLALTGLPLPAFQQLLSPFLFALLVLPIAWITYRELAGSSLAAGLATLLLALQPEFLFTALRGSHEKLTRALMLLALLLLARSLRVGAQPGRFALHVLLFYAAAFGVVACNNLLGSSFILALAMALAGGRLLGPPAARPPASGARPPRPNRSANDPGAARPAVQAVHRRLLYATAALLAIAFAFGFYAYPPAAKDVAVYREVWQKLLVLLLSVERAGTPYAALASGWINWPAYALVSLPDWLLLGASLGFWLRDGWRWLVRRRPPESAAAWLLWLLYGAFAAQSAGSVLVDLSGALGTNLQHRAFATFVLLAVAVAARGLRPLVASGAGAGRVPWRPARTLLAAGAGCLAVLSILKASNEPLLSNKWTFYAPPELQALRWADGHLRYATIWTDFDERLIAAYALVVAAETAPGAPAVRRNTLAGFRPDPRVRDFLVTDVTRLRAARLGIALPPAFGQLRTYDNGLAQVHHRAPTTPFQR